MSARRSLTSSLFPYTTLFRSVFVGDVVESAARALSAGKSGTWNVGTAVETSVNRLFELIARALSSKSRLTEVSKDRKSTRMNHSQQIISYVAFCIKKKYNIYI